MKLIVDNGSTKSDWCFIDEGGYRQTVQTEGINPIIQTEQEIKSILCGCLTNDSHLQDINLQSVSDIFFYGAGCNSDTRGKIIAILREFINTEANIEVESDLLGAARALCGHDRGIVCILGTGSNSCYYNGKKIMLHTPALGYILGDEGSGAVLGRKFINGILKGTLPHSMRDEYLEWNGMTTSDIIYNVYKGKSPNRFLASTSLFIAKHLDNEILEQMVIDNFKDFIEKNILPYKMYDIPLNAVGSMAFYYRNQLIKAARATGYHVGEIIKSPIHDLVNYHKHDKC